MKYKLLALCVTMTAGVLAGRTDALAFCLISISSSFGAN